MAKILIVVGLVTLILGLISYYAPWMVSWIGKLPGDIRIENENGSVFIPITSMILLSLVLSIVLNIFGR